MNLILGDYIGFDESLEHEFKEFMFKISPDLYFPSEDIKSFVKSGVLKEKEFNSFVIENLKQYIHFYLPKYISAFGNSDEINEGYLYIGVNNIGEITGVPFLGTLDTEMIQDFINSTQDRIEVDEDNDNILKREIYKNIKLELIQLEIDMELLQDESKEIELQEEKYLQDIQEYNKYKIEHTKWIESLNSFTNKISYISLSKEIRKDVALYIREHCPERNNIADILESDTYIEILNGIQLTDYKSSNDNVYFWIMFYKDYSVDKIRLRRPKKVFYTYPCIDILYLDTLRNLSKLRRKFIENNTKITYYMIKISIPGRKKFLEDDKYIYFQHPNINKKWCQKIRVIGIQGPCCI